MTERHARTIPLEAESVQGRPAGLVSRALAAIVDAAVVAGTLITVYAGTAALLFAWSPRTFSLPNWPGAVVLGVAGAIEISYLTVAWWVGGRTYGCALIGLRVVDRAGSTLHLGRAFVRAALCTVFPLGLLWCAVDARGRAVHDLVARSQVIHDWRQRQR